MKTVDIMKCKLVKESTVEYQPCRTFDDVLAVLHTLGIHESADEVFSMLCLDAKGNIVGFHEVSHGDLTSSIVHPREIYKRALLNGAYGVIFAHNHPSGDVTPSSEDISTTKRLCEAGEILGIQVMDHIILGQENHLSFRADGLL